MSLILGDGTDALSVARWFGAQLQWARKGRTFRTQALRLAIESGKLESATAHKV
jgi:hypothetical protein